MARFDADKCLLDAMTTIHGEVAKLKKKAKTTDLTFAEVQVLERAAYTSIRFMDHEQDEATIVAKHLAEMKASDWDALVEANKTPMPVSGSMP